MRCMLVEFGDYNNFVLFTNMIQLCNAICWIYLCIQHQGHHSNINNNSSDYDRYTANMIVAHLIIIWYPVRPEVFDLSNLYQNNKSLNQYVLISKYKTPNILACSNRLTDTCKQID